MLRRRNQGQDRYQMKRTAVVLSVLTFAGLATVVCEATAPFVELSSADTTNGIVWQGGVPLEPNGDFRIDETLRAPIGSGVSAIPSECASPTLLIRSSGNGAWLAAGIPRLADNN